MNKAILYEVFQKEFQQIENERDILREKLRKGRNLWATAQLIGELEVREHELERIFMKLKVWF